MVTGWWPLLQLLVLDSSDARLHLHDALASGSTSISGRWMVQAPAFFLGFALGSSFSLPVLAAGLRWLLPWFFVGYLLACHRGAAVPLASGVLWCS